LPALREPFRFGPLHPDDLLLCIGAAMSTLFVLELLYERTLLPENGWWHDALWRAVSLEQELVVDSVRDFGLVAMIWINMKGRQPSRHWSSRVFRDVAGE
jgi:hypothetical protein